MKLHLEGVWAAWLALLVGAVVASLLLIVGSAVPGGQWGALFGAFFLGLPVAILWLVLVVAVALEQRGHLGRWQLVRWLAIPLTGLLAVGLVASDLPLRAGFELSRGPLEDLARRLQPGETITSSVQAGWYTIGSGQAYEDGVVYLSVEGAGFIDECGFAFVPSGQPPKTSRIEFTHLDGPWWTFDYHW